MESITLQAIPNQSVIVTVGGDRYEIPIKSASGFMVYGIIKNGETIIETGMRLVNGNYLLPYQYLESGNFFLIVPDDELPNYESFESTQFLKYLTQDEVDSIR